MTFRDRVKDFRRVRASDLEPNPRNWRTHPQAQRAALQGVLAEVGIADALLARELPDGRLRLVDGHLRADLDGQAEWPVLVLDITEDEERLLLATLDPLAAMAEASQQALGDLLAGLETESAAVRGMLEGLAAGHGIDVFESAAEEARPPGEFAEVGEDLKTDYRCPKCGYEWSGKSK